MNKLNKGVLRLSDGQEVPALINPDQVVAITADGVRLSDGSLAIITEKNFLELTEKYFKMRGNE